MSIDGAVSAGVVLNDRRTVGAGSSAVITANESPSVAFTNGSGANQINQVYGANGTFSGTTATLNLNTGLSDSYGTNVTLVRFKSIFIQNTSASNNLVVGDAGSDPITTFLNGTGTITLPPGAFVRAATPDATGWVITPSTAMNLLLTGTSGQPYVIVVGGSTT